ncbi:hypothetical protein AUJ46_04035 [Candidatus Peregrinibacteria bacterium CG1_02_54_53]|nr:MAG: hypothetical protein AUJ46_04035 [Candidatus Peregrinibacteria bacterium CG1_02_54_53]
MLFSFFVRATKKERKKTLRRQSTLRPALCLLADSYKDSESSRRSSPHVRGRAFLFTPRGGGPTFQDLVNYHQLTQVAYTSFS